MKWHYTDGWNLDDFSSSVTISDDAELSAGQKTPFVQVASSAASKTLTLGLGEGDCMILMNSGENAITVKNVSGDTGSSVAKGDIVLIVASETADATSVDVLNASGGGGGTGGALILHADNSNVLDKTWKEIYDAAQESSVIWADGTVAETDLNPLRAIGQDIGSGTYMLMFHDLNNEIVVFATDSENGYPVINMGGGE